MSSHARIGRLIQSLRDALSTQKPPYCAGTAQIPQDQYTLFYGPTGNAQYVKLSNYRRDNIEYSLFTNINTISRIDLSRAAESELANLSASCEPATFGVDQKDVLDESYRKARKLDVADLPPNSNCTSQKSWMSFALHFLKVTIVTDRSKQSCTD